MTKLEQAARQLLSVIENGMIDINAVTALKEALDHSGEANEMVGCAYCNNPLFAGTKCNNCGLVTLAEQAEQTPACNPHPDAPHGFCRDASHSYDRYVCECEFWEPEENKIYTQAELEAAVLAEREACAKLCETDELCCKCGDECAEAIRARGNHGS
ncbi:MAG: hypothetical protein ACR2IJ_05270 [Fluviibacter sp.]